MPQLYPPYAPRLRKPEDMEQKISKENLEVSGVKVDNVDNIFFITLVISQYLFFLPRNVDYKVVFEAFDSEVNVHYVVWNIFVRMPMERDHVEVGVVSTSTGLFPLDFRETSAALIELV